MSEQVVRAHAKISSGIRSPLDPAGGVTLFGKGTAIACKACLASGAQEHPRYYEIMLARALNRVAGRMVLRRLLALGILCALVLPRLLIAEGVGPWYGKFRPLHQPGEKPPVAQRARRYSGEAGYHLRGPTDAPPAYAPSGDPYPRRPAVQSGFFMAYPHGSPGLRFRSGPRSGKAPAQRASSVRSLDKGFYPVLSAPPESAYRFRPPGRGRHE
ncbi:hypothetical protein [Sedimenticola hydrogenitrophicus]|uniref:hypothetical protein n=1 Tax=Sedimenticola hydrogenitrophicus TaxID=2967975 RepID=UPI0021A8DD1B|nr:hypothetical protein [Sedimenticola hydrogenitrophicus]